MLKNINRITSYIMRSDFKTPVTVVIEGRELVATPAIHRGKIGVIANQTFYGASSIQSMFV